MATIQFKKGDEYLAKIAKLEASLRDEICGGDCGRRNPSLTGADPDR